MNNLIQSRFGTSERLQLASGEWLENGIHAKTVNFNTCQGGEAPEVNWEDKAAAIGLIKDDVAKALVSLLVWGSNENWDWSTHFDVVVEHLKLRMLHRCNLDKRKAPVGCVHNLEDLAYLMARMTLHFELYDLWPYYTTEGKLLFSGITMNDKTYSNYFLKYQKAMLDDDIPSLTSSIDDAVIGYRYSLDM